MKNGVPGRRSGDWSARRRAGLDLHVWESGVSGVGSGARGNHIYAETPWGPEDPGVTLDQEKEGDEVGRRLCHSRVGEGQGA